ncbi:MAG: ArsR/SmtB family transcription factor [Candidatus Kapaibacterium sp.]
MDEIRNIFKALSDPNRIRILKMLEIKPLCACEISTALGIAASTASAHLSILKDSGLIADRRDGKWIEYSLNPSESITIRQQLALLAGWMNDDPLVAQDRERIGHVNREIICKTN